MPGRTCQHAQLLALWRLTWHVPATQGAVVLLADSLNEVLTTACNACEQQGAIVLLADILNEVLTTACNACEQQ